MDSSEKGLAVAALLIDMLSAYVLVKRIAVRYRALRPAHSPNPSRDDLRLVS
jgi:hypothetical protein